MKRKWCGNARKTRKYTNEIENIKMTASLHLMKEKSKLIDHRKWMNQRNAPAPSSRPLSSAESMINP